MKTQHDKIIDILSDGRWHDGHEFLFAGITQHNTRMDELRKIGFILENRSPKKSEVKHPMYEWRCLGRTDHIPSNMRSFRAPDMSIKKKEIKKSNKLKKALQRRLFPLP